MDYGKFTMILEIIVKVMQLLHTKGQVWSLIVYTCKISCKLQFFVRMLTLSHLLVYQGSFKLSLLHLVMCRFLNHQCILIILIHQPLLQISFGVVIWTVLLYIRLMLFIPCLLLVFLFNASKYFCTKFNKLYIYLDNLVFYYTQQKL